MEPDLSPTVLGEMMDEDIQALMEAQDEEELEEEEENEES